MGVIEKRVRKTRIKKILLETVGAVGGLALAMAAPNMLKLFRYKTSNSSAYQSIRRLAESGFIVISGEQGMRTCALTKKGDLYIKRIRELEKFSIPRRRWDGKWRILSFDISEKNRNNRNLLRGTLSKVGFVRLHHSAWVYPHNCEDFIQLLKLDFKFGRNVLYIVAEEIENDYWLRKHFGLPLR